MTKIVLTLVYRMTLLLGPPGSGKTTLLKALAGKPDDDMKVCAFVLPIITGLIKIICFQNFCESADV